MSNNPNHGKLDPKRPDQKLRQFQKADVARIKLPAGTPTPTPGSLLKGDPLGLTGKAQPKTKAKP